MSLQEYVKNSKHPFLPITRVAQGQHFELFEAAFDDRAAVSASHVSELYSDAMDIIIMMYLY